MPLPSGLYTNINRALRYSSLVSGACKWIHGADYRAYSVCFSKCARLSIFFFWGARLYYTRCVAPRGTIETENLLCRFAKYLTAPPGPNDFVYFLYSHIVYYGYTLNVLLRNSRNRRFSSSSLFLLFIYFF